MQQFTVRPDSFKDIQNKIIKVTAFIFCVVLFFVIGLPMLISDDPANVGSSPYMIVLFGGIFAFSIRNAVKRQKALFESFKLVIDDEKITRERLNTPVMVIYRKDVQRITKRSSGTFCIEGDSKLNAIGVPSQVDNYEQLEKALNAIKPIIVHTKKSFVEQMVFPIVLIVPGLFVGHFYITNNIFSIACGILLVLILVSSFYISVTNKNIDSRTKGVAYFSLFIVALIIFSLFKKFGGS
ncbi:hypothetical protein [Chryseolinea sp. H1M3-3]|uniref:hypothetical protein n=1 Tax=Chryseolinea sp. H1M3-3 TaxID=3034144 RepID=UPI0023EDD388|nr:hypothetical protein [Chryseolinea sp. H1M3-3]